MKTEKGESPKPEGSDNDSRIKMGKFPGREVPRRPALFTPIPEGQRFLPRGSERQQQTDGEQGSGTQVTRKLDEVMQRKLEASRAERIAHVKAWLESPEYLAVALEEITESEKKAASPEEVHAASTDEVTLLDEMRQLDTRLERVNGLISNLEQYKDEAGCKQIVGIQKDDWGNQVDDNLFGLIMKTSDDPEDMERVMVFNNGRIVVLYPEDTQRIAVYTAAVTKLNETSALTRDTDFLDFDTGHIARTNLVEAVVADLMKYNAAFPLFDSDRIVDQAEAYKYADKALKRLEKAHEEHEVTAFIEQHTSITSESVLVFEMQNGGRDRDALRRAYADQQAEEADKSGEGMEEILEKIKTQAQKLVDIREAIPVLNEEERGVAIMRVNKATGEKELCGVGVTFYKDTDHPVTLMISEGDILLAHPVSNKPEHLEKFLYMVNRNQGDLLCRMEGDVYVDETVYRQRITNGLRALVGQYDGVVAFSTENPEDWDRIISHIDALNRQRDKDFADEAQRFLTNGGEPPSTQAA